MKITVITAAFNSEATIADALASVAAQRDVDVEHLVIDGASSDGTVAVARRFPHVARLVSEPDRGIYDALNKGIALANGDAVGFLHSDDVYANALVLAGVAQAFADPAVQAVYGDLVYVRKGDVGRVVRHWRSCPFTPALLYRGWMPPHPTLYVRRSVYERVGLFDIGLRIAADYDSVLRIFGAVGSSSTYLPHVLVRMRAGGTSNRSLANIVRKSREDLAVMRRHSVGGLWTLAAKNLAKLGQFWRHSA